MVLKDKTTPENLKKGRCTFGAPKNEKPA